MYFFVAKLFSIAIMTYIYDYHLRSSCPMVWLICYAYNDRSTCAWRDSTAVWCLLSREPLRILA